MISSINKKNKSLMYAQKRYMHKKFVCGNAEIITRKIGDKNLVYFPHALVQDNKYLYDKSTLMNHNYRFKIIKKELAELDKKDKNLTFEIRNLLFNAKLEEIEYITKYKNEIKETINYKKIELLEKEGMNQIKKESIILDNEKYLDDYYESTSKIIRYGMPTIKHSFSGYIFNNENGLSMIAFTFHTSKEEFKLFGTKFQNIKINEELNPIKFTNPMHIIELEKFKKIFKLESPTEMIKKPMFGHGEKYDAVYCAYRAYIESIKNGDSTIWLVNDKLKNSECNRVIHSKFISGESHTLTPCEVTLKKASLDIYKLFEEDIIFMNNIKDNIEGKKGLLSDTISNFHENF